jgi:predicted nuclease of predicted toxin-antitoxin system
VAVQLLLDENLSEHLLPGLLSRFPGSAHVRTLGKAGAADAELWTIARDHGFMLVTRDEDFVGLSVLHGAPPKVVWLNVGNPRNTQVERLLRENADAIERFAAHEDATFLALAFAALAR